MRRVPGMKIISTNRLRWFWLLAVLFSTNIAFGQGTQVQFGQNRVQYKDFDWQFYEGEHFQVYFSAGGLNLGKFVAQIAEADLIQIEDLLDYKLNSKPEIIVYNTISD
ncbi:MAG TPA: hypothetical protein PLM90_04925, partial [Chitinophagales bacterium]|nr:hypothetical protein [Chitinophagales bacterium]